jgi:hypothetical protein
VRSAETGGFRVPKLSPDKVTKFLREDAERWREVGRSANIVLE